MWTYYCDQTGSGQVSILGGVVLADDDLHNVTQRAMDFKVSEGLKASNPIKTAGWKEDRRYKGMQKHGNVPVLLTRFCELIAATGEILIIGCVLDNEERKLDTDGVDYFLIQNCAKRVQFLVEDITKEYPDGPVELWFVAQRPRKKKGVKARIIADHPGSKLEGKWNDHYSEIWKFAARPYTHLLHMADSMAFDHARSNVLLQMADVVAGAIRSYVVGEAKERFEILLPRFRTSQRGLVNGYGLIFDRKKGRLWQKFRDDYPDLTGS